MLRAREASEKLVQVLSIQEVVEIVGHNWRRGGGVFGRRDGGRRQGRGSCRRVHSHGRRRRRPQQGLGLRAADAAGRFAKQGGPLLGGGGVTLLGHRARSPPCRRRGRRRRGGRDGRGGTAAAEEGAEGGVAK